MHYKIKIDLIRGLGFLNIKTPKIKVLSRIIFHKLTSIINLLLSHIPMSIITTIIRIMNNLWNLVWEFVRSWTITFEASPNFSDPLGWATEEYYDAKCSDWFSEKTTGDRCLEIWSAPYNSWLSFILKKNSTS